MSFLHCNGPQSATVAKQLGLAEWCMQEYTDDTADLRQQVDMLGGMASLQDPESQLQALTVLEHFVSAVH